MSTMPIAGLLAAGDAFLSALASHGSSVRLAAPVRNPFTDGRGCLNASLRANPGNAHDVSSVVHQAAPFLARVSDFPAGRVVGGFSSSTN